MKNTQGNSQVRVEVSIDKLCLLHNFALGCGSSWCTWRNPHRLPSSRFQFASVGGKLPEVIGKAHHLRFYPFISESPRTSPVHLDVPESLAFPCIF